MMWVFAILVVLAMGGIALLAAGRGTPMVDVYDDRPDATVPGDRPLGPEDLRRVRFSLAFRGYRMSEVDALLDRLATELAGEAPVDAEEAVEEGPREVSAEATPAAAPEAPEAVDQESGAGQAPTTGRHVAPEGRGGTNDD